MIRVLALVLCVLFLTGADTLCAQILDTTVDMRSAAVEVVTWIIGALGVVLSTLAGVAVRLVFAKFGLTNSQLEQNLNDRLNDIIFKGMDYAHATALNEVNKRGSGLEAVKFDNLFISYAASYIVRAAPEILKRFKVDQNRLEELIWARIPAFAQTVPITGGATTTATANAVNRATGGPAVPADIQPRPVVMTLPAGRSSGTVVGEAPNTGA